MSAHAIVVDKLLSHMRITQGSFEVEFGNHVIFRTTKGSWPVNCVDGSVERDLGGGSESELGGSLSEVEVLRGEQFRLEGVDHVGVGERVSGRTELERKFCEESLDRGKVQESRGGAFCVVNDDADTDKLRGNKCAGCDGTQKLGSSSGGVSGGVTPVAEGVVLGVQSACAAAGSVSVDPRTVRNRLERERKKKRKERKRAGLGKLPLGPSQVCPVVPEVPEWRRGKFSVLAGPGLGRNGKPVKPDGVGFWKSCDEKTLQELVESKARMHIANNVRKAKEDEARVQYLDSPQALADRAMDMIAAAQKKAEKLNDDKVVGWARTVTRSSAESLARSVPSTVPSFDSFSSAVDEAASVEKKAQVDQELALVCADLELLKKDNDELREKNRVLSVRAAISPPAALKLSSDKKQPGETTQQHFERVKRMGIISANFRY